MLKKYVMGYLVKQLIELKIWRQIKKQKYMISIPTQHKRINLQDIFKWFKNNNIKYYSSYPAIEQGLINGLHTNVSNDF